MVYEDEDDVKGRILKAAAELFMERGFGGASVREIGERAGVGQSSLYHHVQSKGYLLQELHRSFAQELLAKLELVTSSDAPAADQLREVIHLFLTTVETHQSRVTVSLREHHALSAEAKQEIQHDRDRLDQLVDSVIQRGIDTGEFRDDLDVHLTRLAVLGMCNWSYEWYRPSGPRKITEISDYFADLVLQGMVAQRGR
jgi:TetR/AcrR family transcriptional regulator, cholesterol catabolism regulator